MAKKLYIPKYDTQGNVTWYTYDASGNLIITTAPTNQDVNMNPSTLIFEYSVNGECFKRVVTECLDCTDGEWDTEACYNKAGELVTCPDFSDTTTYEVGCTSCNKCVIDLFDIGATCISSEEELNKLMCDYSEDNNCSQGSIFTLEGSCFILEGQVEDFVFIQNGTTYNFYNGVEAIILSCAEDGDLNSLANLETQWNSIGLDGQWTLSYIKSPSLGDCNVIIKYCYSGAVINSITADGNSLNFCNSDNREWIKEGDCLFKEQLVVKDECGSFTGNCKCYGSQGGDDIFEYTRDVGLSTEGAFSMNSTTLKWDVSGGLDASIPYIDNCIDNGGSATITITDQDGNIVVFTATSKLGISGTTQHNYTGIGPGGFSGKTRSATITCTSSSSEGGKACQWLSCDKLTEKWYDGELELTQEQIDSLVECTIPVSIEPECLESILQIQGCASESTSEVAIGDLILTVAKQNCEDIITSSSQYNITQGNIELTEAVNTSDCDPQPDVVQTEECILDEKDVKWTEITIVQGTSTTTIFINQSDLTIGNPTGEPSEWGNCTVVADCFEIQTICYCVQSKGSVSGSTKKVSKVKSQSTKPGKVLEVCEERRYNCNGEYEYSTYLYQTRQFDQATFDKMNLSVVDCDSPPVTYSPGAVTCATVEVEGTTVVLNCTIFTNDADPSDLFTNYNLADNYIGIGDLNEPYTPSTTVTPIPCPPGSIVETETCYEAQNSIKGLVNTGDVITVKEVTNNIAGTTIYTITNNVGSELYSGTDPLGDAGIDLGDTGQWVIESCTPVIETPSCCPVIKENCMLIDGIVKEVIYAIYPDTGNIKWIKDSLTGINQTVPSKGYPEFIDCCS